MRYEGVYRGIFRGRPNRFLADVELFGEVERCHVKNTGRLRELLIPGTPVWVQKSGKAERKTKYSLIAVEKRTKDGVRTIVNIDSQAPNEAAAQWVQQGAGGLFRQVELVKRERQFGASRFDLYIEADGRKAFMEVKGVTLEADGAARFPDAPTERGVKHVEELMHALEAGYDAYLLFVIQMKGIRRFEPNENTHRAFGEALRAAKAAGVKILAYDCVITEDTMEIDAPVKVELNP